MTLIQMTDVVDLLGLPAPPNGRSSYYVSCPCCDADPRKWHLNINIRKNMFRWGSDASSFDYCQICLRFAIKKQVEFSPFARYNRRSALLYRKDTGRALACAKLRDMV